MSNKKISELSQLLSAGVDVSTDMLAIYDSSANATKKITVQELSSLFSNTFSIQQNGTEVIQSPTLNFMSPFSVSSSSAKAVIDIDLKTIGGQSIEGSGNIGLKTINTQSIIGSGDISISETTLFEGYSGSPPVSASANANRIAFADSFAMSLYLPMGGDPYPIISLANHAVNGQLSAASINSSDEILISQGGSALRKITYSDFVSSSKMNTVVIGYYSMFTVAIASATTVYDVDPPSAVLTDMPDGAPFTINTTTGVITYTGASAVKCIIHGEATCVMDVSDGAERQISLRLNRSSAGDPIGATVDMINRGSTENTESVSWSTFITTLQTNETIRMQVSNNTDTQDVKFLRFSLRIELL